jgi:hypothetical protein
MSRGEFLGRSSSEARSWQTMASRKRAVRFSGSILEGLFEQLDRLCVAVLRGALRLVDELARWHVLLLGINLLILVRGLLVIRFRVVGLLVLGDGRHRVRLDQHGRVTDRDDGRFSGAR